MHGTQLSNHIGAPWLVVQRHDSAVSPHENPTRSLKLRAVLNMRIQPSPVAICEVSASCRLDREVSTRRAAHDLPIK